MPADGSISTSFVVIRTDWSVLTALRALDATDATHSILVHRDAHGEDRYLKRADDLFEMLQGLPTEKSIESEISFEYWTPTPTIAPGDDIGGLSQAIVDDGRRPVAFFDLEEVAERQPGYGAGDEAPAEPVPPPIRRGDGHYATPPTTAGNGGPVRRGGGQHAKPPAPVAGNGGPPKAEGEPQRSLEAEFPETTVVDTVEWLLVSIVNAAPSETGLAIDVAPGESIDVLVQPRRGFSVEGDARGTLEVPAEGESLPLQFKLKAVDEGKGLIRILAFHLGEPLGVITLEPTVEAAPATRARGRTASAPAARKGQSLAAPSSQVPDLSLFIEEHETGGALEFVIRLTAADPALDLNLRPFGPFRLEVAPAEFFETFFQEIDELPLETKEQRELAARRLTAKGAYLTESLMPADLRESLWQLRDRIASVIIQSEEPWIPWELCRLMGKDGDRVVEGPFLCEAFAVTRWLPGEGFKRPLHLTNLALIVPTDSGLPLATDERDFVLSLAKDGRSVTAIDPTFAKVQDAFAEGIYDGWHFTGHGAARDANPDRSSIILTGDESFTPEDVSGQASNVGIPHPLVFINACQVGRGGMGLTGIGGWARRFVQSGAGAFIGAYWSVYDEAAFDFAKEVYTRLLDEKPIGDAVREARAKVRADGDPTWLAYTVFADPLARVEARST
jgi:hypothetical protein